MSKYKIVSIKDNYKEWDTFVLNSPQGTIFSLSKYLLNIGKKFKLFFIKKGNDTRAGFTVLVDELDSKIIFDDLIIYNGLMFIENEKIKETRAKTERFEITQLIIKYLDERYDQIYMQLSPAFEDLRPFLWHNYHSENLKDKFVLNLRYTSFLNINDLFYKKELSKNNVFLSLDNRRQADIQKAEENDLQFISDNIPTELFIDFYERTLRSQNQIVDNKYLGRMANLIEETTKLNLLKKFAVTNINGELTYITIFGLFNQTGTYIFGAGNENLMQRYDATYCLWNVINYINHNYGISEIDMEGINSPNRGAFKLDFGGSITSYYEVKLGR